MTNPELARTHPNIADPIRAINFAVDECDDDAAGFLETWRVGDWTGIRDNWPDYLERAK